MLGRQAQLSRRLSSISLSIDRAAGSGGLIIAMVQTAEPRHCYDPATNAEVRCGFPTGRCSIRQRKVSSVFMVIADVLKHESLQVAFIEHDHMVEQITTTATHTHHLSLSHLYFCLTGKLNLCAMHNADNKQKEDAPVSALIARTCQPCISTPGGPMWPGACCDPGGRCYLDVDLEKHLSSVGRGGDAVVRIRLRRSESLRKSLRRS